MLLLLQDGENVLFVSTHGFGRHFYPGSGATVGLDGNPVKPSESSPGIINFGVTKDTPSSAWRHEVLTVILPQIANFSPDLILISAGFDAHKKVGTVLQVERTKFPRLRVHCRRCVLSGHCQPRVHRTGGGRLRVGDAAADEACQRVLQGARACAV